MPSKPEVLKERRLNDPEFAEKCREATRKYRAANLEAERQRDKEAKAKKRSEDRAAHNAYMRSWNSANSERLNLEERERRKNDQDYAEKIRQQDRDRYAKNPRNHKHIRLKSIYGLGIQDFDKMRKDQNYCCAICGKHEDESAKGLAVDHCHTEGQVRGLLCSHCNTGLGQFKDDVSLLQKAIEYLNKFKE